VNKELGGKKNLQVSDIFLADCKKYNLKMLIDIHGVKDDLLNDNLWYDAEHPVEYIVGALEWFATCYKSDDTVIRINIKNEPHGRCDAKSGAAIWDESTRPENWKRFVETTSERLLAINPNLLMLVEGIECWEGSWGWRGGNLVPYSYFPINLGQCQNKLVFAPHEYGPSVYKDQWWLRPGFTYRTLYDDHWYGMWMYLWGRGNGPILIGECGGHTMGDDLTWMKAMVQLITNYSLSQTFW
jgi:aryl-phospho-beta-D-glucosidase BglC (GH1 family)